VEVLDTSWNTFIIFAITFKRPGNRLAEIQAVGGCLVLRTPLQTSSSSWDASRMLRVGDIIVPQRKRVRTTKVLEIEQRNGDIEWQEEGETSEGTLGQNRARKQAAPKSSAGMVEEIQSLRQVLEQDFDKKIESMKAEFQLEFAKVRDRMAEEVTRATA
jgi:hypothetical protein